MFDRRGLAVSDYVRQIPLNHARRLLRESALDIGEVSLRCGYGALSAFGQAFRRRFGMPPPRRPEARRGGNDGVRPATSRWTPHHQTTKRKLNYREHLLNPRQ